MSASPWTWHFTGSPRSARSWARNDNLVASAASHGTSVSLKASSFSSTLKPGVVNGFVLLPSRSLSTSSACLMSGSILTYLLPLESVPTDTTVQQLSVAFTVVPSQDGALLARSTCQIRSCPSGPVRARCAKPVH